MTTVRSLSRELGVGMAVIANQAQWLIDIEGLDAVIIYGGGMTEPTLTDGAETFLRSHFARLRRTKRAGPAIETDRVNEALRSSLSWEG
jgi:hypothetical protein